MEQIEKLKAELEQVQKDLTYYCTKASKNFGYGSHPYRKEISELCGRRLSTKQN